MASRKSPYLKMIQILVTLLMVPVPPLIFGLHITSNRAGPFRILLRELGNCSKEVSTGTLNFLEAHITTAKAGQLQYVWGKYVNNAGVNDAQQLMVTLDRKINEGWKKNVFVFRMDSACSSIRRLSPPVAKVLFGKDWNKCPIPAVGDRVVQNQTINWNFPEIPVFPYGRWLCNSRLVKDGKDLGCIRAEVDVVPKKVGAD